VIKPEDSQLWLPSALCSKPIPCNARLLETEWELRYAQAGDALEEIRQYLRLQDYMYTFKRDWLRSQSANTQAQNALSRVEARATAAAEKYRAAHTVLSSLVHVLGKVGWDHKYQVLDRKNDIRGMSVPKRGESEGRRQLSWIWLVEGVGDDEDEVIQDSKLKCEPWQIDTQIAGRSQSRMVQSSREVHAMGRRSWAAPGGDAPGVLLS